jgi:hypothetical protein
MPKNQASSYKSLFHSHSCEFCLKKSKQAPDYDGRHFCSKDCRIKYRKLKIKTPFVGEHLVSPRNGFIHHGLGDEKGGVLHYAGLSEAAASGPVIRSDFDKFRHGHKIIVVPHKHRKYGLLESVERAKQRIGEENYDMPTNNCEHFVSWCINGKVKSKQVEKVALYSTVISVFLIAILVFNVFAATGAAAVGTNHFFPRLSQIHGTSLAFVFCLIGIIGGIGLTIALNFSILRNFVWLSTEEKRSRRIARASAFFTVLITAFIGFVYISMLSERVLRSGGLIEKMETETLIRLVNISFLLATGLPAIMAVIVGLSVHKFLSRNISQV